MRQLNHNTPSRAPNRLRLRVGRFGQPNSAPPRVGTNGVPTLRDHARHGVAGFVRPGRVGTVFVPTRKEPGRVGTVFVPTRNERRTTQCANSTTTRHRAIGIGCGFASGDLGNGAWCHHAWARTACPPYAIMHGTGSLASCGPVGWARFLCPRGTRNQQSNASTQPRHAIARPESVAASRRAIWAIRLGTATRGHERRAHPTRS